MLSFLSNIVNWMKGSGAESYEKSAIDQLNPKFNDFDSLSEKEQEAIKNSIFEKYFNQGPDETYKIGYDNVASYSQYVYGGIATEKPKRLESYRRMAQFPEVSNAIDEICDAAVCKDDEGNICKLNIKNDKLSDFQKEEINEKYCEYISLFDLNRNHYNNVRTMVIEGEIAWENIIDQENKDRGIIGINYLPTESYEFLIDKTAIKQGITVYTNDKEQPLTQQNSSYSSGGVHVQSIDSYNQEKKSNEQYSNEYITGKEKIELSQKKGIPMKWEQLTYIDSGIYNNNKMIVYPVLERARKAYRQLSLIEDAILIYRLARAPSRYIFNIEIPSGMNFSKGIQEVYKLMKRYQTKKFYNPTTGSVSNDYDPFSILESIFLPKREGSSGSSVTTLDSRVEWTKLPDLEYFQQKLYECLKIPYKSRLAGSETKVDIKIGDSISYEEYKFAKFIMRINDRFSAGFTKGFITHLKLTGLWDSYNLKNNDLAIEFTEPVTYSLFEQAKLTKARVAMYNDITANHDEISKEMAMKKYLGFTEIEIEENNKKREKEAMFNAELKYKAAKIETGGNPYVVK